MSAQVSSCLSAFENALASTTSLAFRDIALDRCVCVCLDWGSGRW